jgi:hypothetical protein
MNKIDNVLKLSILFLLAVWIFSRALLYQAEYPTRLVELYNEPLWRIALIVLTITAFMWCPSIGILLAFAVIMYFSDLESLSK